MIRRRSESLVAWTFRMRAFVGARAVHCYSVARCRCSRLQQGDRVAFLPAAMGRGTGKISVQRQRADGAGRSVYESWQLGYHRR